MAKTKTKKRNVASIAKRGKAKQSKVVETKAPIAETGTIEIGPTITFDNTVEVTTENRDELAKKKVEELVGDIDILTKNKEDDKEPVKEDKGSVEWLTDQVTLLSEDREKLRKELSNLKKAGEGSVGETVNEGLIKFFVELQNNMLGNNQERTAWKDVKILNILKSMNDLFPYTIKFNKF